MIQSVNKEYIFPADSVTKSCQEDLRKKFTHRQAGMDRQDRLGIQRVPFFQKRKRAQQFAIRLARFFDLHRMQNAVLFRDEIDLFHVLIPVEIEIDLPLLFDVKMKLIIF